MNDQHNRIVITGVGIISPIGIGKTDFWNNACAGNHGITDLEFSPDKNGTPFLGGIIDEFVAKNYISKRKLLKIMSRSMQLAAGATAIAVEDSGIELDSFDPQRLGISIGTGMIHTSVTELGEPIYTTKEELGFNLSNFAAIAMDQLFPLWLLKQLPNLVASHISILFNAQGASNTLTSGAGAAIQAIEEAVYNIQNGICDMYICGGADHRTHPLDMIKYQLLDFLPDQSPDIHDMFRPYDKHRQGFIPGEAAAIFTIESLEHAKKRGAHIYAEIRGCGSAAGVSYRDKDIDKRTYIESLAIEQCIKNTNGSVDSIDYICGHGCGDILGDSVEIMAYKKALGTSAESIPISSPSSMVGYIGAATGAINTACALFAMQDSVIPPTLFLQDPDPQCAFNHVTGSTREQTVNTALINSFDFYGQGATMIISKYEQ